MYVSPLLTPAEASELLKIPRAQLANWRNTRKVNIPYIKLGASVRYRLDDLQTYISSNTHN